MRQPLQNAWLCTRQQVHCIRIRTLTQHIFKGQGVEQEKTLDGQQTQLLRMADNVGTRGDNSICNRILRNEIRADIFGCHPFNQVCMDKYQFAGILSTLRK